MRATGARREGDVWKGLAAGAVGGLAAAFVMNRYQALLSRRLAGEERAHGAQSLQQGAPRHGVARALQERGADDERDDAAERAAAGLAAEVFDERLTEREKDAAGTLVHYAFGVTTGAAYGAAVELLPAARAGAGVPFGAFVWLTADEGIVPLLGLSKSADDYTPATHLYSLTSHLVYGLTAELVRRAVRAAL
ncbi:MAG TPA: DUF1440 domain-containing protein [Pyrinomonadaceae bacterium]|jgi:putative membrane protein